VPGERSGDAAGAVSDTFTHRFHVTRITTSRLVLREYRAAEFETFAREFAAPLSRTHLPGPVDRRTAWRVFASAMGTWMLTGAGWWAVELLATGQLVGTVGAFFRETALDGKLPVDLELGWVLFRPFWRQGIATEAATAARTFGFETIGAPRLIAHISPGNVASIRVAERLGMRRELDDVDFYGEERVSRYAVERP
jgi:RimJ/RimL family protein N-acetyltransferase